MHQIWLTRYGGSPQVWWRKKTFEGPHSFDFEIHTKRKCSNFFREFRRAGGAT
jgi:hypothetical protein